ncbi:MAG: helix-turn-helix transcriptional regulator [Spirochaetales bacterium]|nr:helix-turn-helix transcriptional regulator [Spirochaetales bacterium]
MDLVLEDLFLTGSFLLSAHGITSLFYLKYAENREQENMLRGIAITFLPLLPFFTLDMLFFKGMAFKLTYLSYATFCVNIYLFISRHYIRKYEPEPGNLEPQSDRLIQAGFSKREIEIISLVIKGQTNKEIGEELFISINTVKTHIKNIYAKLKVTNRIQLINKTRTI